jgi:murein DD-endopeptidase MepM/ murein hydrolase activator NlpD
LKKVIGGGILAFSIATPAYAFLDYKSPFRAGIIDWVRGAPEGDKMDPGTRFLSGSVLRQGGKDVNSPVPCTTKKCRHVEFVNLPGIPDLVDTAGGLLGTASKQKDNPLSVLGNRWEVGPDHLVPGGFGVLAVGPLALEPTGRLVVQGVDGPAAVKIVIIEVNEQKETVLLQGYGRNCLKAPPPLKGWISCTAFNIPLPMFFVISRGVVMPVDIKISGNMKNPLALTEKAKLVQAGFANRLKKGLTAKGISIGTSVLGSLPTGGGGNGGNGGTTSSPTTNDPAAAGSVNFNGQTMRPLGNAPISSGFGNRVHPIHGTVKFHDGIDFPAPTGTPVLAVASGRVMYQGILGGYGKTLIIDHGGGYSSLYAHLDSFLTGGPGTIIPMGAPIARVGSTGDSTGPHLHLNIRAGGDGRDIRSGYDIDPRTFIKGL